MNKYSVSRFGDGEFGLITSSNNPDFQAKNDLLSSRLSEIASSNSNHVLICIPHSFKYRRDCNKYAYDFWEWWLWNNSNLEKISQILQLDSKHSKCFGDAQMTRPYMDWKKKSKAKKIFDELKNIWLDKDILIVEGEKTRLGLGNDLFKSASSIARIICPSINAFDCYDEILSTTTYFAEKKLILIALGPTATVLAYDLGQKGFWAIDIGHIDIEYEWFLSGATEKVAVVGKEVQEIHTDCTEVGNDDEYESQIVKRILC